jgi:hypothetical protein
MPRLLRNRLAGHTVVELVSLTGRSPWHHDIAHPLTHPGQPALSPSLLLVTQHGTTWVVLIERGTGAGGRSDIMRLSTFKRPQASPVAPPARQPGAGHGLTTSGGDIAISVEDPNPDSTFHTVLMDPATGKLTRYDSAPGRNADYAWNQGVVGTYHGEPLYRRQRTAMFTTGPYGLYFHGQPISWHGAPGTTAPGLVATPGDTLLGDVDLDTGKQLPLRCYTGTPAACPPPPRAGTPSSKATSSTSAPAPPPASGPTRTGPPSLTRPSATDGCQATSPRRSTSHHYTRHRHTAARRHSAATGHRPRRLRRLRHRHPRRRHRHRPAAPLTAPPHQNAGRPTQS